MVELILEAGADVNENSGRPLRAASKAGQLEEVDLLLRSRADANAADARIHKTANASSALMMAAAENHGATQRKLQQRLAKCLPESRPDQPSTTDVKQEND